MPDRTPAPSKKGPKKVQGKCHERVSSAITGGLLGAVTLTATKRANNEEVLTSLLWQSRVLALKKSKQTINETRSQSLTVTLTATRRANNEEVGLDPLALQRSCLEKILTQTIHATRSQPLTGIVSPPMPRKEITPTRDRRAMRVGT